MQHEHLTKQIIRCATSVHRALGNDFHQSIYQRALAIEFEREGLPFKRECEIPIYYFEENIGMLRADFLVSEKILVEIKVQHTLEEINTIQFLNCLEGFKMKVGVLINFGGRSLEFKRIDHNALKPLLHSEDR